MESGFGAQSAWRQLTDLMGRGRIPADAASLDRLRELRSVVPLAIRAASARALAFARPPAALIGFFAEDAIEVAAPLLRTAQLADSDWLALLPRLDLHGRALLRHRRDLPGAVERGLASFGPADFVLRYDAPAPANDLAEPVTPTDTVALFPQPQPPAPPPPPEPNAEGGFQIADLVARIDAFQKQRDPNEPIAAVASEPPSYFHFDTDHLGIIRAVDGVTRGALIGASLAVGLPQGEVRVDAVITGALRQRQRFAGARLDVGGHSDAAGAWRVAGTPQFDAESGRFTGYVAIARRPRADEEASLAPRKMVSDSLRQLVHELRTPTNAIAGFAELIEAQLLGPVAPVYREHAVTIRQQAASLLGAIEDLDTAARIEGKAL
ncbi:MAG: hypothetical protein EOP65_02380, partial [Sphingomonas sp.]